MYPAAHDSKKRALGFTLIELLLAIAIIGVLSGLILAVSNAVGIRGRSNDAQRTADLKKIQTALEVYFADNNRYPNTSGSWVQVTHTPSNILYSDLFNVTNPYLNGIPEDPSGDSGSDSNPCNNPDFHRYHYASTSNGTAYILAAIMERPESNDASSCHSLTNWGTAHNLGTGVCGGGASYATSDFCYGVQNP